MSLSDIIQKIHFIPNNSNLFELINNYTNLLNIEIVLNFI